MILGAHVSISGGVHKSINRAVKLGCESFQIFTQNHRRWYNTNLDPERISNFGKLRLINYDNVPICAHASYLINLCAAEPENLSKSRQALIDELTRCDLLGIDYLVIHPGAYTQKTEKWGIDTIVSSINQVLSKLEVRTKILLETTAGQGTSIGYNFKQLAQILSEVDKKEQMGICLDTCHIYAAGYQISTIPGIQKTMDVLDQEIGLQYLQLLHLNDSKTECGSRVDRHAAISKGLIGKKCFEWLINQSDFSDIPGIIEIPGDENDYLNNLALLKSMRD